MYDKRVTAPGGQISDFISGSIRTSLSFNSFSNFKYECTIFRLYYKIYIHVIIIEIKHKDTNNTISDKSNSLIFSNCNYSTTNGVKLRKNL